MSSVLELAAVSIDGDHWFAENAGLDADAIMNAARTALSTTEAEDG